MSHCWRCTRTRAHSQGARLPRAPPALKLPPLSVSSRTSARGPPGFLPRFLSLPLGGTANVDGEPPLLRDILAESSLEPPLESRVP